MDNTKLEEKILEILKNGAKTSEEIRNELIQENIDFTPLQFREALAKMVREGKVKKIPNYERKKILFSI
jgi:hypothetical protein